MWRKRVPIGQRSEVTNPLFAIVGAMAIIAVAIVALSFWPNTQTLRTEPTANLPDQQKGTAHAPGSRAGTN
jgi:hypothetical protein